MIVVAASIAMIRSMDRVARAVTALEATYKAIDGASALMTRVEALESSQRGYLLTGEPAFLGNFEAALLGVEVQERRLGQLAANHAQRVRLAAIERSLGDKLEFTAKAVALARAGDIAGARALVASGDGRRSMAQLRRSVVVFLAPQRRLLAQQRAAAATAVRNARQQAFGSAILILAAGALAITLARRSRAELGRRTYAAARARRRFRATFDQAAVGIALLAPDGIVLRVNPKLCEITGYRREELVGGWFEAITHAEDIARELARRRALLTGEHEQYGSEYRCARADGSLRWISVTGSLVRDSDGTPEFFVCIVADISERRASEARLAESEARIRLTQQAVHVGTWETDLTTNRSTLSEESLRLFGLPADREAVIERGTIAARAEPIDGRRIIAQFDRAVAERRRLDMVMRIRMPDGGVRWVQTIGQPQYDADGKPLRMIGLNIDVTEQRETEAALLESQERLRALQSEFAHLARVNELGELAAAIAHEINQPLTAITNYLNTARLALAILEDGGDASGAALVEAAEVATLAAGQAVRAGEIVRRLRAFVAKGADARRPEHFDEIVDSAMSLSLVDAELAGIAVNRHRGAEDVLVNVEAIQIQQVLVNLLRNAIDALRDLPEGESRQLDIGTRVVTTDNMVEVSVKDSGAGVVPDVLNRLFEPFVTSKPTGMGMGLSLSRRLIEAHGGTIEVQSETGLGATFRFRLPVLRSTARPN